jgi:hypothetical protein
MVVPPNVGVTQQKYPWLTSHGAPLHWIDPGVPVVPPPLEPVVVGAAPSAGGCLVPLSGACFDPPLSGACFEPPLSGACFMPLSGGCFIGEPSGCDEGPPSSSESPLPSSGPQCTSASGPTTIKGTSQVKALLLGMMASQRINRSSSILVGLK